MKKKVSKIDVYVVFSLAMVLIYTAILLTMQCLGVVVNDTLTTCFFGVFGGECVSCVVLKWLKVKRSE